MSGSRNGRLDSSLAMEFQALIETWSDEGCFHIILDLTDVDFIDSTILGVVVQWFKRVRGKQGDTDGTVGGNLAICNIGFKIASLLKLTRMDRVFSMYDNEDEAVQALTGDYL